MLTRPILMPVQLTPLSAIATALRSAQRIAIAAHVRPDGDAVGSVLGLALNYTAWSMRQGGQVAVIGTSARVMRARFNV